jgi:hypothetical protein
MWCGRRTEKINWTNRVKNEILQKVKEDRNIMCVIKRRKAECIGPTFRRICHVKHVIEVSRMDMTEIRRRRSKQLLDDLKETRGYWKLKEEALNRTL